MGCWVEQLGERTELGGMRERGVGRGMKLEMGQGEWELELLVLGLGSGSGLGRVVEPAPHWS